MLHCAMSEKLLNNLLSSTENISAFLFNYTKIQFNAESIINPDNFEILISWSGNRTRDVAHKYS